MSNANEVFLDWRLYWRPMKIILRKNSFRVFLCLYFPPRTFKKPKNINTALTVASESRSNTYDAPCIQFKKTSPPQSKPGCSRASGTS